MKKDGIEKVVELVMIEERKRDKCIRNGHPNSTLMEISGPSGSPRAKYYCPDCGEFYNRGLSDEQWKKYSLVW